MLKELQRITSDLQLSRTTPVRAKDIPAQVPAAPENLIDDKDQVVCTEMRSQAMIYGVQRPERRRFVRAKLLPACSAENVVPGVNRELTISHRR